MHPVEAKDKDILSECSQLHERKKFLCVMGGYLSDTVTRIQPRWGKLAN